MKKRNNNMIKRIAIFIIVFMVSIQYCSRSYSAPLKILNPIDVSGKVLDKNGDLFVGNAEILLTVEIGTLDYDLPDLEGQSEYKTYKMQAHNGTFSWKGEGSSVTVEAVKEGYHSTYVDVYYDSPMSEEGRQIIEEARIKGEGLTYDLIDKVTRTEVIKSDDILIYLIPKGVPSTLQYTGSAYIPGKKDQESGGKRCGWSFSKRWYYPVDGDVPVDIIRGPNEKNKRTYTIKEPGGFIYFEGYPVFGSEKKGVYSYASFDLMPEAPETGYVSTFTPSEHKPTFRGNSYFCYFKTPDGKYGKICFEGELSYYINPDGSRNLEVEKFWYRPPLNPNIEHMPDDNEAYLPDE